MLRREFIGLLSGVATSIWPAAALAQTYPSRPITMVVPFPFRGTGNSGHDLVKEARDRL
jgi:tripartite-type tricarboxylate transporter receptor subunit TctC